MIINHNLSAMFAFRQNKFTNINLDKNIEKLSSGLRINRGSDDAAGLAVSEKMRSQIRGLNQAERNAADGISLIQTTEGYLQEVHSILTRIRELAIQASNGIYSSEDRRNIQVEVSQLVDEINRIATTAQFNGFNLLTGRFARQDATNIVTGSMWFHIGANMDQRERTYIGTMTAQALGIQSANGLPQFASSITVLTPNNANATIGAVDGAIFRVSQQRADLGAYQNRLEFARQGLTNSAENLQAAESRIRDLDMAEETVDFVKNQILSQSSLAMLAQANQKNQSILQLLQ